MFILEFYPIVFGFVLCGNKGHLVTGILGQFYKCLKKKKKIHPSGLPELYQPGAFILLLRRLSTLFIIFVILMRNSCNFKSLERQKTKV